MSLELIPLNPTLNVGVQHSALANEPFFDSFTWVSCEALHR